MLTTDFDLTTLTIYLNKSQLEKLSILADSDNPLEVESYANELFTDYLLYESLPEVEAEAKRLTEVRTEVKTLYL